MLETQPISVNFGQGTDTKTDPKLVVSGKLTRLENGVFNKAGQVAKRNGYAALSLAKVGGGTLSSPKGCKSYQSELVVPDSGRLYSYSSQLSAWVDKGKYQSIKVTDSYVTRSAYSDSLPSAATVGNIALYAWSSNGQSFAKVVDISTNTVLLQDYALGGVDSVPFAVQMGFTKLGVVYNNQQTLYFVPLSVSAAGVSFGAPVTISTNLCKDAFLVRTTSYDVASTPSGCVVVHITASTYTGAAQGLAVKTLDLTGTVVNTATLDPSGQTSIPRAIVGSNSNIWIYWAHSDTSPYGMYYAILSPTLGSILGKTTIASDTNGIYQFTALATSSTTQTFFYCTTPFGIGSPTPHTFEYAVTSSGSVTSSGQKLAGVVIASDPVTVSGASYMAFGFYSPSNTQGSLFLLDISDYKVVSKGLSGRWTPGTSTTTYGARNVRPIVYSPTKIGIPTLFVEQLDSFFGFIMSQEGVAAPTFDFNHQDAYQAVNAGSVQLWNGGIVTMYDGNQAVELGFHIFPETPTMSDSGVAGSLTTGAVYKYFAVYRWFDAQGNMHQSAPSPAGSYTTTNSNAINVTVNNLYLTTKTNTNSPVQILIYRTTNGGSIPYLVTQIGAPITSNPIVDKATFQDGIPDSSLSSLEMIYSNPLIAGSVIENISPPPSMLMTTHNNRVYLVSSETGEVWYSKTIQDGVGISFSDLFAQAVDTRDGDVTAIASMDDKFVAFKQDLFFVQSGDGPNDTGSGATLTNFQLVPSDAGCIQSKGVALLPTGILFKSSKGIYLADRALNSTYVGAPVENYNAQNITSAVLLKDKNQVRFLTDAGLTLVYDYVFNQWSTFTNHQGYASDSWQGIYCYIRTDGNVFKESTTSFLDNAAAYKLLAQTSWLKLSAVQGFQRVRRVAMLGDIQGVSGHGIQISAAYDYGTTFSTPVPYTPSTAGTLQYRERLAQQKCEAVQLLVEEVSTGAAGEYIDFTDLTFEAGIKRGLNKLPAAQSAG